MYQKENKAINKCIIYTEHRDPWTSSLIRLLLNTTIPFWGIINIEINNNTIKHINENIMFILYNIKHLFKGFIKFICSEEKITPYRFLVRKIISRKIFSMLKFILKKKRGGNHFSTYSMHICIITQIYKIQ